MTSPLPREAVQAICEALQAEGDEAGVARALEALAVHAPAEEVTLTLALTLIPTLTLTLTLTLTPTPTRTLGAHLRRDTSPLGRARRPQHFPHAPTPTLTRTLTLTLTLTLTPTPTLTRTLPPTPTLPLIQP